MTLPHMTLPLTISLLATALLDRHFFGCLRGISAVVPPSACTGVGWFAIRSGILSGKTPIVSGEVLDRPDGAGVIGGRCWIMEM
jgi:hypothetical protein